MKLIAKIFGTLTKFVMYTWMIIALIPLFVGIIMIDILLKLVGVEKAFLLLTGFTLWVETLSAYLKIHTNNSKNTTGE